MCTLKSYTLHLNEKESIMSIFPNNQWGEHIFDIRIDDNEGKFVGNIQNIINHNVIFSGKCYESLKKSYEMTVKEYIKNPNAFKLKTGDALSIARLTFQVQLKSIFSEEELKKISQKKTGERLHPVYALIKNLEEKSFDKEAEHTAAVNTDYSVEIIKNKNPDYFKSIKKRLLETSDYTNPMSALAEIRAFSALIQAGFNPKNIPQQKKSTPDFHFFINGIECLVEVHAKYLSKNSDCAILEELCEKKENESVFIKSIISRAPFGQSMENTTSKEIDTNVISKVCAMKEEEKQFDESKINILWIDLQDPETFPCKIPLDYCLPYYTHSRLVLTSPPQLAPLPYTGCIWQAFYGDKNEPIIENIDESAIETRFMAHDGRFSKFSSSKLNFAIISLPDAIVVYENPNRCHMDNLENVRRQFYLMPTFSSQHSMLETHADILKHDIALKKTQRQYCFESYILRLNS